MKLGEWMDANPQGNMTGLRLAGPTGDPWTLAHAWRVGTEEPPQVGMFLHEGDATSGDCKTVFTSWDAWREWTVREP